MRLPPLLLALLLAASATSSAVSADDSPPDSIDRDPASGFPAWGGAPDDAVYSGVARVVDGDTLVIGGENIMLAEVAAPEPGTPCEAVRGVRSYDKNESIVGVNPRETGTLPDGLFRIVTLETRGGWWDKTEQRGPIVDAGDLARRYLEHLIDGRTVTCTSRWRAHGLAWAECRAHGARRTLNLAMIEDGYAVGDPRYESLGLPEIEAFYQRDLRQAHFMSFGLQSWDGCGRNEVPLRFTGGEERKGFPWPLPADPSAE